MNSTLLLKLPLVLLGISGCASAQAYKDLTTSSAGDTVYFSPGAGNAAGLVYAIRSGAPQLISTSADQVDFDDSGTISAMASYHPQICNAGSTCDFAGRCRGGFSIQSAGSAVVSGPSYQTFIRLDSAGRLAWIEQGQNCYSYTERYGSRIALPPLSGLYETSSLRQVLPANGATLANRRHGRRLITQTRRALTFVGPQLTWLDTTGSHPIRHIAGAFEAVTDSLGINVVYVESELGKLHWIDGEDRDLGVTGSAPSLSPDGTELFFLAADRSLWRLERGSGSMRRLGSDAYSEFVVGGRAVFAVTADDRIVRIDITDGSSSTWLKPYAQIQSADAPQYYQPFCPQYCYSPRPDTSVVGRGMLLILRGQHLDEPGWRVRTVGTGATPPPYAMNSPLRALSKTTAWVQVPTDMSLDDTITSYQVLEIYHPDHPVATRLRVQVRPMMIICLVTAHEGFSRSISASDPAAVGETVHVLLTGLRGVEPVPDGVENPTDRLVEVADPPLLSDPAAMVPTFLGLAPGLIGVQQLNLRIFAPSNKASLFLNQSSWGCAPPPVAKR